MFGAPVPVTACETAQQVMEIARQVRERRRLSRLPVVKPVQSIAPAWVPFRSVFQRAPEEAVADLWVMTTGYPFEPEPAVFVPKIIEIQNVVCKQFKVTRAELISAIRTKNILPPRHIAMMLARNLTSRSLPEIGRKFGGRDHTTVLHACHKYEWLAELLRPSFEKSTELSTIVSLARQFLLERIE